MRKKLLSLALALALCLGLTVPALAADRAFGGISGKGLVSAAVKEDGSLWMWGYNYYGQVGNGTREHALSPVKVMEDVAFVTTGCYYITAALKTDGSVWTWGKTDFEASAGSIRKLSTVPEKVMDGVSALFANGYTLAAIKPDNSLWMWGSLPHKTRENTGRTVHIPEKVMDDVAYVYPGQPTAIIKTDGSLWMWGSNTRGEIGNGSTKDALLPVKIMDDVADIAETEWVKCALKKDGSVWAWGYVEGNEALFGGAAAGNAEANYGTVQTVPVKIMDGVRSIKAMEYNFGAIKDDGSLWVWGKNDGSAALPFDGYNAPTKMLDGVREIAGTIDAYAAIRDDESLWMWGAVPGSNEFRYTAKPEKVMDGVKTFAPNISQNYMLLKTDGSLWAWGNNECGTVGNGGQSNSQAGLTGAVPYQTYPAKIMDGVALTAGTVNPAPAAAKASSRFTDVAAGSAFEEAIGWAVDNKITSGKTTTTFAPGEKCSTAQILTFLWRANGGLDPLVNENSFSDVSPSDYYYKAALWARDQGLLDDWTKFNGSAPCTRAAAVTYLWKMADKPMPTTETSFTDVGANSGYAKIVAWAVENGITGGTGNGQFSPNATCTRGQIVTFLYRAMEK